MLSSNLDNMMGMCKACGPVRILLNKTKKGPYPRCINAVNEQKARRVAGGTLTRTEREELIARVGCCQICGATENLVPDHDHATREVRGVLCRKHNQGMGFFGDSEEGFERALMYLRLHRINRTGK